MKGEKRGRVATRLFIRFEIDPEGAAKSVLDAIRTHEGMLPRVAEALGIGERTLDRLLADRPELGNAAKAAREAAKAARDASKHAAKAAAKGATS